MGSPSLCELPDDVLHCILNHASAFSCKALAQTSSRFRDIAADPLLWRLYCQNDFQFWDQRHDFAASLKCPASAVGWKDLYRTRHLVDIATTRLLNSILASQTGRIKKVHTVIGFGYDAKDTLLRHAAADPDGEDYLARRYYSTAILGCLHRTIAIPEWCRLKNGESVPLERALGVFDMFILQTRPGDFDDISRYLDQVVSSLLAEIPGIRDYTPREKAYRIAQYLLANNLTGIETGEEYYKAEHNFLSLALTSEGHNSLPLISAVIYCAVAQRLELDASPCGFPFHVHVIIRPGPGYDLDGNFLSTGQEMPQMFMDPFRSTRETPVSDLERQLNFLGAMTISHRTFLRESRVSEIVLRSGINIRNSVERRTPVDHSNAEYAALWACMLFGQGVTGDHHQEIRRYLPSLFENFAGEFPLDVYLMEQYIVPMFHNLPEHGPLLDAVSVMKTGDEIPKQVCRRTSEHSNVRYRVGQVFRHRRYDYVAIITGWDAECGAEEVWMERMGIDSLRAGRHQSFYHALVHDKSTRYVAEENIQIIEPDISELPTLLVDLAGKYFKRWDHASSRFVSNVRDEYPDD